jgi:hypothetical protein
MQRLQAVSATVIFEHSNQQQHESNNDNLTQLDNSQIQPTPKLHAVRRSHS